MDCIPCFVVVASGRRHGGLQASSGHGVEERSLGVVRCPVKTRGKSTGMEFHQPLGNEHILNILEHLLDNG